jgi:hypothetical protein
MKYNIGDKIKYKIDGVYYTVTGHKCDKGENLYNLSYTCTYYKESFIDSNFTLFSSSCGGTCGSSGCGSSCGSATYMQGEALECINDFGSFCTGFLYSIASTGMNFMGTEYAYISDSSGNQTYFTFQDIPSYFKKANNTTCSGSCTGNCAACEDDVSEFFRPTEEECCHEWEHYNGITDSFDYCKKCDKKRRE